MMETSVPVPFGPDFLCIGMGKAGTGWLYDSLKRHPDFWMPPVKEIHYLDNDVPKLPWATSKIGKAPDRLNRAREARGKRLLEERDFAFVREAAAAAGMPMRLEVYGALFRFKQDKLSGDLTPGYGTMDEERIAAVMNAFPRLKIVLLVRDPVSRAWSHFCMKLRKERVAKDEILHPDNLRALLAKPNSNATGSPSRIARSWARHVPQGQFRFFFFDDIQADPDRAIAEILMFLGADPTRLPEVAGNRKADLSKLEMPSEIRELLVAALADELRQCAEYFGGPAVGWLEKYGLGSA